MVLIYIAILGVAIPIIISIIKLWIDVKAMKENSQLSKDQIEATKELANSDNTKIVVDDKNSYKAKYSIEYLKKMISGGKLADEVTVQFSKDYPLKLEYIAIDKLRLAFILAPRVENE